MGLGPFVRLRNFAENAFSLLEPSDRKAAGPVARCRSSWPPRQVDLGMTRRVHRSHKRLPPSACTTRTGELTIAPHQDGHRLIGRVSSPRCTARCCLSVHTVCAPGEHVVAQRRSPTSAVGRSQPLLLHELVRSPKRSWSETNQSDAADTPRNDDDAVAPGFSTHREGERLAPDSEGAMRKARFTEEQVAATCASAPGPCPRRLLRSRFRLI
jgi:hypothetical protein